MKWPVVLVVSLFFISPVYAYTGSFSIWPPFAGNADQVIEMYEIDTTIENPQILVVGMNVVEELTIETTIPLTAPILITESPKKESYSFSVNVPMTVQNELVSATIYFWGPDIDYLEIAHNHPGNDPEMLEATKINSDGEDGLALWKFTTYSFSDFYLEQPQENNRGLPFLSILSLLGVTIIALFVLRRD